MRIRLAMINEKKQVLDILNKVTLDLHQKGIKQWDYPWQANKCGVDIKKNYAYVLLIEDKIVGTFFIKDIDCLSEFKILSKSKYLYQIAILPEYQRNNLGSVILIFACSLATDIKKTIFLDCWSENDKLKKFYVKNGFEILGDFPEENYFITIFKYNEFNS